MLEQTCKDCSKKFLFERKRGRRPVRCSDCREKAKAAFRKNKEKN